MARDTQSRSTLHDAIERDTHLMSTLQAMERDTPCRSTLLVVCINLHAAGGENKYTLASA